jgi:heme oxygenase (biliverdin-producing, ferredoxin)
MTAESPERANDLVDVASHTAPQASLVELLRENTRALHTRAERSGIINDILHGQASRYGYALFLRNLLPAYQQLEAGLRANRHSAPASAAAREELYRTAFLEADLVQLAGARWERALPFLPAGEEYARRIAAAARGDGSGLIAHAYTRYLGDLSGGQILKRLLARAPGLGAEELTFYDFPEIDDTQRFKESYRRALNNVAASITDLAAVLAEAAAAFELNIAVSEAVQLSSAAPA